MEHFPEFESDPTEVKFQLGNGEEITCNKYNTSLFYFIGHEIFNHIYYLRDNGQPLYIFNSERIMKTLKNSGFDTFKSTVPPSETDQNMFFAYAQNKLATGAEKYLKDK